jgi:hypothetical protein
MHSPGERFRGEFQLSTHALFWPWNRKRIWDGAGDSFFLQDTSELRLYNKLYKILFFWISEHAHMAVSVSRFALQLNSSLPLVVNILSALGACRPNAFIIISLQELRVRNHSRNHSSLERLVRFLPVLVVYLSPLC